MMGKLAPLAALLCALFAGATGDGCGRPSRKYPPNLRVSGDDILGISHGIVPRGSEAEPHSYPWIVDVGNGCSGALVAKRWALTAAHCVVADGHALQGDRHVRLGQHAGGPSGGGQRASVKRVVHPPGYARRCSGKADDIALLEFKDDVQYGDKVQPICLPSAGDDFRRHGNMVVAGWGRSVYDSQATRLRQFVVHGEHDECRATYGGRFNDDKEMCATAAGRGSCEGGSGGPLFGLVDGRYTIMGVVSCGHGEEYASCAGGEYPGVYTHVPFYRQWITDNAGV